MKSLLLVAASLSVSSAAIAGPPDRVAVVHVSVHTNVRDAKRAALEERMGQRQLDLLVASVLNQEEKVASARPRANERLTFANR